MEDMRQEDARIERKKKRRKGVSERAHVRAGQTCCDTILNFMISKIKKT